MLPAQAISSAISIICVKPTWRSSAGRASPVKMWSEIVQMHSAFLPARGVQIQRGGFHLRRQHAQLLELGRAAGLVVEDIGGIQRADVRLDAHLARGGNSGVQQLKRAARRDVAVEPLAPEIGIGVGAHAHHDVADFHIVADAAGGAHADDVLHAVEVVQLVGVDTDGRHAHAGGHHGDALALVIAGVALHAADVVDHHGVLEEGLGDELRAQRIAGHQHGTGEIALLGGDVGGRNIGMGHDVILLLHSLMRLLYSAKKELPTGYFIAGRYVDRHAGNPANRRATLDCFWMLPYNRGD